MKSKGRPATGISVDGAKGYAKWLSARASKIEETDIVYRLPSAAEWTYAAAAVGNQPAKTNFNCRVTSGGQVIKGHDLVDADNGNPNEWGVTNYVGNAQEWVASSGTVVVRGGAYVDDLAKCEPSLSRNHSGTPDAITGFRLVREMGG